MKPRLIPTVAAAALAIAMQSDDAAAQIAERPFTLSIGGGVGEYDVSGVDSAPLLTLRGAWTVSRLFVAEASLLHAALEQQFGRTRLWVPELQLQIRWPLAVVSPYLGAGIGMAVDVPRSDEFSTDTEPSFSGALGARVAPAGRVGLQVDLRVRGMGTGFEASGAEATAGLTIRF